MGNMSYFQSGAFPGVPLFISKCSPFIPKAFYPKKADVLENTESQLGIYPNNTETLI